MTYPVVVDLKTTLCVLFVGDEKKDTLYGRVLYLCKKNLKHSVLYKSSREANMKITNGVKDTLNKCGGYFRVVNNKSFEVWLVKDGVYEVVGSDTLDGADYVCLKIDAFSDDSLWVAAERGEYFIGGAASFAEDRASKHERYYSKLKPSRIIDIPPNTETCHTLDLERVQYVGEPLPKEVDEDESYRLTMGWSESIKLSNKVFPRKEFVRLWKAYHGQTN